MVDLQAVGLVRMRPWWSGLAETFRGVSPLGRTERIVVLTTIAAYLCSTVITEWAAAREATWFVIASSALVGLLALFCWLPTLAAVVLAVAGATILLPGLHGFPVIVMVIAAGLVARTCRAAVIAGYVLCFAAYVVIAGSSVGPPTLERVLATVLLAAVCVTLGAMARVFVTRHDGMVRSLNEHAAQRDLAVQIERQRIADELHDFVAHDLVVITMQSRMLETGQNEGEVGEAARSIRGVAQRALADVRRVIDLEWGDTAPQEVAPIDVDTAIADFVATVESSGRRVRSVQALGERDLPRLVSATLVRLLRETATNILKHAGPGRVEVSLTGSSPSITLRVVSAVDGEPTPLSRSEGYGTVRMRERVAHLGGTYESGPVAHGWRVEVTLPVDRAIAWRG